MTASEGACVILRDPEFLSDLQLAATEIGKSPEQAQIYARKCLKEIEATPRDT